MRLVVILSLLSVLFISCDDSAKSSDTINEPLILSGGSTYPGDECGPDTYPCPPYGTRQYQTVRDIPFLPANPFTEALAGEDGIARMRSFYALKNQGYQLLLITATTEWCEVCEAQMSSMPAMVEQYGHQSASPKVAFLAVVTEDYDLNNASVEIASTYSADHDMDDLMAVTNDENWYFRDLMTSSSYPFNIFIDLNTMEILDYDSGLETEQVFSARLDEMLAFIGK